jgi:excisionase family DNA binding protein
MEASLRGGFLTVAEVAAYIRTSKMTVYRLMEKGDIPAIRVGRNFRIAEADAEAYIKSCAVATETEETT